MNKFLKNLFDFKFPLKKLGSINIRTNNKKIEGTSWSNPII